MRPILFIAPALLLFAACQPPKPPPTEQPPEPQATQLHDAMQAPLDQARAAEAALKETVDKQRADLEAAGG